MVLALTVTTTIAVIGTESHHTTRTIIETIVVVMARTGATMTVPHATMTDRVRLILILPDHHEVATMISDAATAIVGVVAVTTETGLIVVIRHHQEIIGIVTEIVAANDTNGIIMQIWNIMMIIEIYDKGPTKLPVIVYILVLL